MKQVLNLMLIAVTVIFFTACTKIKGEGPIVTEVRAITGFTSVGTGISGTVNYKQDNNFKVEILAQDNIIEIIETNIVNNELILKFKSGVRVRSHEPIVVNISSPVINALRVSGSGNMHVDGPIDADNFSLAVSGSGNISAPSVTADEIQATISGSGSIQVPQGTADKANLRISGSGNIDMQNLAVREAITATSGSGHTRLKVSEKLNVQISGSGSVYYKGTPVINSSISGSGKVIHVD